MMLLNEIGGFLRWILKGCRTELKDELYGGTYENHIVGLLFCIIFVLIMAILF